MDRTTFQRLVDNTTGETSNGGKKNHEHKEETIGLQTSDSYNPSGYNQWDIGVNVWDPIMRCFGQHYGLIDVWGELSLYNRFKPIFEIGLGVLIPATTSSP